MQAVRGTARTGTKRDLRVANDGAALAFRKTDAAQLRPRERPFAELRVEDDRTGIRGDESACEASGIDTTRHKLAALAVSAFFAGAGGALYAFFQQQAGPHLFGVSTSISVIIMSYVGGIGSVYGAIGGAFLLTFMSEGLRRFGEHRLLFYSLVLIVIVFFLPTGIVAPLWRRLRGARPSP